MDRRAFIQQLAFSSMALSLPFGWRSAHAAGHDDRLLVTFAADGAWDPTYFCDPHGDRPNHTFYTDSQVLQTASGLRYAPKTVDGGVQPYRVGGGADFFAKWADEMLVLRGLETLTNAHEVGVRHVWGGFKNGGYPSLGALLAAKRAGDQPMAYMSTGGFDVNGDLVHTTRIGRVPPLMAAARPNRVALGGADERTFHSPTTQAHIAAAQAASIDRQIAAAGTPYAARLLGQLKSARGMEASFAPLLARLDSLPALSASQLNNPLIQQAQVVFAALAEGVTTSANLSMTGFDSHSKHDDPGPLNGQRPRLQELLDAIDYFLDLAKTEPAIYGRLVVVAGSDFGRSKYNAAEVAARGKDHWPITSALCFGSLIGGGRTIGQTTLDDDDSGPLAKALNGDAQVTSAADPNGQNLRPAHLHHALRSLLQISESDAAQRFPVVFEQGLSPLPLFPPGS
jgi:hypothetical protein